jgi:hypothetical protein
MQLKGVQTAMKAIDEEDITGVAEHCKYIGNGNQCNKGRTAPSQQTSGMSGNRFDDTE